MRWLRVIQRRRCWRGCVASYGAVASILHRRLLRLLRLLLLLLLGMPDFFASVPIFGSILEDDFVSRVALTSFFQDLIACVETEFHQRLDGFLQGRWRRRWPISQSRRDGGASSSPAASTRSSAASCGSAPARGRTASCPTTTGTGICDGFSGDILVQREIDVRHNFRSSLYL